jgi:hypothetical protein
VDLPTQGGPTNPVMTFLFVGLPRFELGTFGPQIAAPQAPDRSKHPETCPGLRFWLVTASRCFALFCDT